MVSDHGQIKPKTKQRFVSTWPQIWSKSVEISIDCENAGAPLIAPPPRSPQTRLILSFPAILLAISAIFELVGCAFELESSDFAGFNVQNNKLINECELEKSGLSNNEYDGPHTHTTHTAALVIGSHDKIWPTGVVLRDLDIIERIFNGNIDDHGLQYDISFGM